jgi:hypothetical protein
MSVQIDIENFTKHIPPWGGNIVEWKEMKGTQIKICNTCTIDYYLLAIWCSSIMSGKIHEFLRSTGNEEDLKNNLTVIIELIENLNWNKAKTVWLLGICKLDSQINQISKSIDTFGNEYEFFYRYFACLQVFNLTETCLNDKCPMVRTEKIIKQNYLYFINEKKKVVLNIQSFKTCKRCKIALDVKFEFLSNPCWLILEIAAGINLSIVELPRSFKLNSNEYHLLCATFYIVGRKHFKAVFFINEIFYMVDDLKPNELKRQTPKNKVLTCFYYRR